MHNYANYAPGPGLCDSKVISRALLRFVAVCNWLLPVCRPLLSCANECELFVRPQRELRKRCILDSPLRALEPSRLGLGSRGRVRRRSRYAAPEEFKFRRTDSESISVLPLAFGPVDALLLHDDYALRVNEKQE